MEKRTKPVKFWLNEAEEKIITKGIELSGMNRAGFIRSCLLSRSKQLIKENELLGINK